MADDRLAFLPAAMADLDRIADCYLQTAGADSAGRITDQILNTAEHLAEYPYLGSPHPDPVLAAMEYRRILSGEYVCVYKVIDKAAIVYRIVRGATAYPKFFYP